MHRTTACPARNASRSFAAVTAGFDAPYGSDRPIASIALAIVLAVYMPPHEPWPGQLSHSTLCSVFSSIVARLEFSDRLEDRDDVDVLAVRADARAGCSRRRRRRSGR